MGFPPHSVFIGKSEDELIMIHSCVFEHDRLCAFFLFFFLYSYIVIVLCVLKTGMRRVKVKTVRMTADSGGGVETI